MGEVVQFRRPGANSAKGKGKGEGKNKNNTLCRSGFHKWEPVNDRPFDVKLGRLVTRYRCARCGAERTETR